MTIKNFQFLGQIGHGSFGKVQKVRRITDSNIYAMKKIQISNLDSKSKNNALNQIRILASLTSPYIITYHQAFFQQKLDLLCIVMQYGDGGDLRSLISHHKKNGDNIPQDIIWTHLIDIVQGLNTLHSYQILHRDLKLENIFLVDGHAKIGDLNVSKIKKKGIVLTQTGTPYYASPQVWNDKPYDSKSDIWSLGCIIYQMACLNPPFEGKNMHQLYLKVTKGKYIQIGNNYSKQLKQLISLCLNIDPKLRPNSKQLLDHPFLIKNMKRPINISQEYNNKLFINTILMPFNKKQLNHKLPMPNYKDININCKQMVKDNIQKVQSCSNLIQQSNKKRRSFPRTQRSLKRLDINNKVNEGQKNQSINIYQFLNKKLHKKNNKYPETKKQDSIKKQNKHMSQIIKQRQIIQNRVSQKHPSLYSKQSLIKLLLQAKIPNIIYKKGIL